MENGNTEYLKSLVHELKKLPKETEWIEFKHNDDNPEEIGEYISALSNSAALSGKVNAYLVWGIDNNTHDIIGTSFIPSKKKVGNEELESWLLRLLSPKINFRFFELMLDEYAVTILEIAAAFRHPVQFKHQEFIRIGSYKKKLKEFPEKERELWRIFDKTPFERQIAVEDVPTENVINFIDYPAYFDLLNIPLPETRSSVLQQLCEEDFLRPSKIGKWNVTNLGAVLFAKKLSSYHSLKRKSVRVIIYKGNSRIETIFEQEITKGYACGFEGLMNLIETLLPANEIIGLALRKVNFMFPPLAVRELIANALIHQDFYLSGTGPMIEIFSNRMEITNPGIPLIKTDRFLDSPPKSRNEAIAAFMRRIGVCEERGSGIDKVIFQTELYQLPAPVFEITDEHTRIVLFAHRDLKEMDKEDRIRSAYLHACLRYVQRDFMTNATLRKRFGIEEKNSAMVSRIIKDTVSAGKIRCYDETAGRKSKKYLPWWAYGVS